MYCSQCAQFLLPDLIYCTNCGSKLNTDDETETVIRKAPVERKNKRTWLAIIGCSLLSFIFAAILFSTPSSEKENKTIATPNGTMSNVAVSDGYKAAEDSEQKKGINADSIIKEIVTKPSPPKTTKKQPIELKQRPARQSYAANNTAYDAYGAEYRINNTSANYRFTNTDVNRPIRRTANY